MYQHQCGQWYNWCLNCSPTQSWFTSVHCKKYWMICPLIPELFNIKFSCWNFIEMAMEIFLMLVIASPRQQRVGENLLQGLYGTQACRVICVCWGSALCALLLSCCKKHTRVKGPHNSTLAEASLFCCTYTLQKHWFKLKLAISIIIIEIASW